MKAVIPCAKKEEELFPFSETKPTALMPVMGQPIIDHLIEALKSVGVDEFYIVANHLEGEFRDRFENDADVKIVHQEELTGTAAALEAVDGFNKEFFVVNGDVIVSQRDLENLKKKYENTDSKVSLLAAGEEKPEKFGVLSITNDEVTGIEEKPEEPENSLVNSGIYLFDPDVFEVLEKLDEDETSITDAVRKLVDREEATFELIEDYWVDIGQPKKLLKADQVKREFHIRETEIADSAEVHEDASITGKAVIKDEAVLKPGAVLEGDVYIGEGAEVEPNTRIKNCSVSHGSIIDAESMRDSIFFEENILDPGVCVEKSVLGEESDVRSGTVIRECFIGARSYIEVNNSIYGVKFVPDARTDLQEISK
ncbi:MAG: sugar phosphate nucleotidyltransferase [Candidatus Nanosalina sp.]